MIISWGLSVTATYPPMPIYLFIHIVKSFSQGEPDVSPTPPPPLPFFPWKQLGFIELALKAWMVENNRLYQLVKSSSGLSLCRECFPRMRLISAPLRRMSDETEILTWKRPDFPCEIGAVSERQPERWKTNVPPTCAWWSLATKITHRLAQRFCWLEPAVPPPLPLTPLLIPLLTFLFSFFFLSSTLLAFYPPFLSLCPPSLHFSPWNSLHTLVLTPLPHFHLWAAGWQQGMRGVGKAFLSWNSCCELWLSTSP